MLPATAYHAIPRIFSWVHGRASHGRTEAVRRQWAPVEGRLLKHYSPDLWTMVRLGYRKERL
jgi:hypothetical protein